MANGSPILQREIDEAKRNAASVHTGWSCTLLAHVEEVEAEVRGLRSLCNDFLKERLMTYPEFKSRYYQLGYAAPRPEEEAHG